MSERDYELICRTIDEYAKLQYIMKSDDPMKEAERQLRIEAAKLQAFGVVTEKLEID